MKLRNEVSPPKKNKTEASQSDIKNMNTTKKENDFKMNSGNQIIYIENDKKLNEYKSKENFFKESETLEKKIKEKYSQIMKLEKNEILRIIKEFDYQEYGFKFQTDCETVLSALIGARKAYRELIRYGMLKKI